MRRRRECVKCGHRWTTFETSFSEADALDAINRALLSIKTAVRPSLAKRRGTPHSAKDVMTRDRRESRAAHAERREKIAELYPKLGGPATAERLGLTPGAVHAVAHRLRLRAPKSIRLARMYKDEA